MAGQQQAAAPTVTAAEHPITGDPVGRATIETITADNFNMLADVAQYVPSYGDDAMGLSTEVETLQTTLGLGTKA